jgi:hypothetical protein
MLPVNVIVASDVPSPAVNDRPDVLPSEMAPLVTETVIRMGLEAMSVSATLMPMMLRFESSAPVWVPGTVTTGASLMSPTIIGSTSLSIFGPPAPVFPRSPATIVSGSDPVKFAFPR